MCDQPEAVESVYWQRNIRYTGLLCRGEIAHKASVGLNAVCNDQAQSGQDDVGQHDLQVSAVNGKSSADSLDLPNGCAKPSNAGEPGIRVRLMYLSIHEGPHGILSADHALRWAGKSRDNDVVWSFFNSNRGVVIYTCCCI